MYCKLDQLMIWSNLPAIHFVWKKWIWCYVNKTEANLASTYALAARCVRVIHAQCVLQFALLSRTLLRSSSNNEPSDPPYRIIVFSVYIYVYICIDIDSYSMTNNNDLLNGKVWNKSWGCRDTHTWLVVDIMVRHNHHAYIHT